MNELKAPAHVSLKKGLEQAAQEIAKSPDWLRAVREQNKRLQLSSSGSEQPKKREPLKRILDGTDAALGDMCGCGHHRHYHHHLSGACELHFAGCACRRFESYEPEAGEKMSEKSVNVSVGPGLPAMLTVAFVVLKLLGKLTWSWWWILSPLWISFAVAATILAGVLLVYVIAAWMKP